MFFLSLLPLTCAFVVPRVHLARWSCRCCSCRPSRPSRRRRPARFRSTETAQTTRGQRGPAGTGQGRREEEDTQTSAHLIFPSCCFFLLLLPLFFFLQHRFSFALPPDSCAFRGRRACDWSDRQWPPAMPMPGRPGAMLPLSSSSSSLSLLTLFVSSAQEMTTLSTSEQHHRQREGARLSRSAIRKEAGVRRG